MKRQLSAVGNLNSITIVLAVMLGLNSIYGQSADKEQAPKSVFTGTVTDACGAPIEGTVAYWGSDHVYPQYHEKAVTDTNGRYRLQTNRTDKLQSHLTVVAGGYAPLWKKNLSPGTQESPQEVNFTLDQGHWLEVAVVDTNDSPVHNVTVTPYFNHELGITLIPGYKPSQTDARGWVLLEDLPANKVKLNFTGKQLTYKQITTQVDKKITITMNPAMIIRGRVLDKESKLPITHFKVQLHGMVAPEELRRGKWFSDPQGRFTLTNLQVPISFDLVIESKNYSYSTYVKEVDPQPPTEAKEDVHYLSRGRLTSGVLLDEAAGEPMPGVIITSALVRHPEFYTINWAGPDGSLLAITQTVTDDKGEFPFLIEDEDNHYPYYDNYETKQTLFIQVKGYEKLMIRPGDRARYKTQTGNLRIALASGASISGVYSINGQPQNKVGIYLHGVEEDFGWIWTGQQGRFHWEDLPAGIYTIQGPFEYRLTLKKGEHKIINLGEEMGPCTLSGCAFKEAEPLACATVTLYPAFEWQFRQFSCQTDGQGRYRFKGLRPGKYEAYPGSRFIDCCNENPYDPETIEIDSNTEQDFDFQKRR